MGVEQVALLREKLESAGTARRKAQEHLSKALAQRKVSPPTPPLRYPSRPSFLLRVPSARCLALSLTGGPGPESPCVSQLQSAGGSH